MIGATRGHLIALEGVDGSGKSTQARILAERLGALHTHEPGATPLGRALRGIVLDADHPAPVPRAEALIMAADRAQHVDEVVIPALEGGRWVVTDRFSASTLAYQGWGRGLEVEELRAVESWASGGLVPDLTILLDLSPADARSRAGADRLERLGPAFFDRVRQGFLAMAESDRRRWVVMDASGTVTDVASRVEEAAVGRLGRPGSTDR